MIGRQETENLKLKYTFNNYILKLSRIDYTKTLRALETAMGIGRDQLNNYRRTQIGETRAMSTDQLIAAAKVLNIQPVELFSKKYLESVHQKEQITASA